eukprot:g14555.t1
MATAIGHVATVGTPTDSMDDVTSAATWYAISSATNVIDTAVDAAASVSEADTTDIQDATAAAANIQDLPAYAVLPTADVSLRNADVSPPDADADSAPPTASTASSSRGDSNTQPCR